jgi:hypothetical protein
MFLIDGHYALVKIGKTFNRRGGKDLSVRLLPEFIPQSVGPLVIQHCAQIVHLDWPFIQGHIFVRMPKVVKMGLTARHTDLDKTETVDARLVHVHTVNTAYLVLALFGNIQRGNPLAFTTTLVFIRQTLHLVFQWVCWRKSKLNLANVFST